MEVGPHTEQLEAITEQPDFLEVYGDRELTVFGITGRLQDLAGMCPVDLSDPRVTLEAKNEFVVKVANESGLEIAPEHVSFFSQVVEKHGQERKFTVAPSEPDQNPTPQRQRQEVRSQDEAPKTRDPHEHTPTKQARPETHAQRAAEPHLRPDSTHAKQAERAPTPARKAVVSRGIATVALNAEVQADAFRRNFGDIVDQPEVTVPAKINKTVASKGDKAATSAARIDKKPVSKKGVVARKPRPQPDARREARAPQPIAVLERPEVKMPVADIEPVRIAERSPVELGTPVELELIDQLTPEDVAMALEDIGLTELAAFESDTENISVVLSEIDQEMVPDELSLPPVVAPDVPPRFIEQVWETEEMQPATRYIAAKVEQAPERVEIITWEDALEKEPLELYDDFTQALEAVILEAAVVEVAQVDETSDPVEFPEAPLNHIQQVAEAEPTPETAAPIPVITKVVADRLRELVEEEKRTVAPVIQEVITLSRIIETLVADDAEVEIVEAATAQLEEQVVLLFEELGIEYVAEDIEQFIRVLLRPDFLPPLQVPAAVTVDLRTEATHEAKWYVTQLLTDGLDEIEFETGQLLGKLAIFYASSKKHSVIAAA